MGHEYHQRLVSLFFAWLGMCGSVLVDMMYGSITGCKDGAAG
jgi:hypothetical protein